jgi:hypothetical protein
MVCLPVPPLPLLVQYLADFEDFAVCIAHSGCLDFRGCTQRRASYSLYTGKRGGSSYAAWVLKIAGRRDEIKKNTPVVFWAENPSFSRELKGR